MSNRFSFEAETRLIRWGESSSAGRTITLELAPDDGDGHPFKGFPTGHTHGQRFRMQFDAIGDDENPIPSAGKSTTPPQPSNRKEVTAAAEPDGTRSPTAPPAEGTHKERRAWDELRPSQQAGILQRERYAALSPPEQAVTRAALLPRDTRFQAWANGCANEDEAVKFIRKRCCDGNTRRLIAEVPEYLDRFLSMETSFKIDVGEISRPR